MSFQEIILPPFVIADLYPYSLIEAIEEKPVKPNVAKAVQINFLGENRKNISIMVNDNNAVYLTDDKLEFLTKMLSACKLTIADVAIVNCSNKSLDYNNIKENFSPSTIILFGIDGRGFKLPLVFPEYRIQEYSHCKMLIAFDLEKYLGNDAATQQEKRKLWECLKELFIA